MVQWCIWLMRLSLRGHDSTPLGSSPTKSFTRFGLAARIRFVYLFLFSSTLQLLPFLSQNQKRNDFMKRSFHSLCITCPTQRVRKRERERDRERETEREKQRQRQISREGETMRQLQTEKDTEGDIERQIIRKRD